MDITSEHICLFCSTTLNITDVVNIQLTITNVGNMNVEEFIKKTLLCVDIAEQLESIYICLTCLDLVNEFEGYFIKSKRIQDCLMKQYVERKESKQKKLESKQNINTTEEDATCSPTQDSVSKIINRSVRTSTRNSKVKYSTIESDDANEDLDNEEKDKETINTLEKSYCCEICGKEYFAYSGFRIHLRMHRNENKFRCEICDRSFTQKVNLQRHNMIHEGIQPHECNICGKKFTHRSSYTVHMAVHSGSRNVQCEICGKGFMTSSNLDRHMRAHSQVKAHPCPECGKTFAEKYNMKSHMRKMHPTNQTNI